LKIFTDLSHYQASHRGHLADILRPFTKGLTEKEQDAKFGISTKHLKWVDQIDQADLCLLPMSLNYYYNSGKMKLYRQFISQSREAKCPCAVFNNGDYGMRCGDRDLIVFRQSGYHSLRFERQINLPVFIRDPLPVLDRIEIQLREYKPVPVIGFCGQADDSFLKKILKPLRLLIHNVKFHIRLSHHEPQSLIPPTWIRRRALAVCSGSEQLRTNFILRRQYQGGAATRQAKDQLKLDFLQNLQHSDYALCVRGTGNFSARFYEAMAMGRIPVFINTDCNLPWQKELPWHALCVWVEYDELDRLPEKILAFHQGLGPDGFRALQKKVRGTWENELSFGGFWRRFLRRFEQGESGKAGERFNRGYTA
jgi:hypothetical protein